MSSGNRFIFPMGIEYINDVDLHKRCWCSRIGGALEFINEKLINHVDFFNNRVISERKLVLCKSTLSPRPTPARRRRCVASEPVLVSYNLIGKVNLSINLCPHGRQ